MRLKATPINFPWKIRHLRTSDKKEIPEMNEHFIHLESPSSLRRLPYFILSDFDAFWHGIVIDQKSGISWPSPIKNDTFFKTIKIFLLYILNEWKGNYPILCSMQHFCPRLDIFFAPTSAHRRHLMDALRHFLGIRHISFFGLFEWSQHHNLHLKRLQCKKIQSSRFFERWPYRHHHIIR